MLKTVLWYFFSFLPTFNRLEMFKCFEIITDFDSQLNFHESFTFWKIKKWFLFLYDLLADRLTPNREPRRDKVGETMIGSGVAVISTASVFRGDAAGLSRASCLASSRSAADSMCATGAITVFDFLGDSFSGLFFRGWWRLLWQANACRVLQMAVHCSQA